jgi:archaeal type IV pilus assembly protein PilA
MARMNNHAVSPVVGVMLMLVVTIIIAAIVSAFAGGLSANTQKAPNVQITAHYSQSQGMWFENDGPDDISTVSTNVYVRCTDSFGTAEHMVWAVNRSSISNISSGTPADKNLWLTAGGMTGGVKTFGVGDRAYILPPYQLASYLQPSASSTYQFSANTNLGKSFWLEMSDKSGRTFAKTKVKIEV